MNAEKPTKTDPVLLDEEDVWISADEIATRDGTYRVRDIEKVSLRIKRPMFGPLALAILGTVNLALGFESGATRDFIAAGVMLGGGVFWWTRGTRYGIAIRIAGKQTDIWWTRHRGQCSRVLETLHAAVEQGGGRSQPHRKMRTRSGQRGQQASGR